MKRLGVFAAVAAFFTLGLTLPAGASSPPLLPGDPTFSTPGDAAVPSFAFGINDTIDYGTPNVDTLPSVQADMKAAGVPIMRIWSFNGDTKAYVDSKLAAATAAGAQCYFMLGSTQNLKWLEKTVGWTDSQCHLYEFGNEPGAWQTETPKGFKQYVNQWTHDIPILRAMFPGTYYGGPTDQTPWFSDSTVPAQYPDAMSFWLARSVATNSIPDFVSWHLYPCEGAASWDTSTANDQADCLSAATLPASQCVNNVNNCQYTGFDWNEVKILGEEQKYLGYEVPTGVSEYNFDGGSSTLSDWANDATFMTNFQDAVSDFFATNGDFSFSMLFTSLNYAGYGDLDTFSDAAPYAPKPQFNALASEIAKYGG